MEPRRTKRALNEFYFKFKAIGAVDSGILNEYSPGESTTSTGMYFALNEDGLSRNIGNGIYGSSWKITFYDDYGFSQDWTLAITISHTNS